MEQISSFTDNGNLRVQATTFSRLSPIEDAVVQIINPDDSKILDEQKTDQNGFAILKEIPAPPLDYSLEPSANQPYATYSVKITKEGFETVLINGSQILATQTAEQNIPMIPLTQIGTGQNFSIGPHTLFGDYPPKIPESEIKPTNESGEIVLSRVVVPEYIVVHDGPPSDSGAQDYYVPFREYIKNVACCEIYATWPIETIKANVLAILSFTLNRVYTEWYRNKGYSFTITSSTAYDHKWINKQTIFDSVSSVVDDLFTNYLSRPNVTQPILTQYCDGKNVTCPNWMPLL